MNDSSFETQLRCLIPAAPGLKLEQQIAAELSGPQPKPIPNAPAPARREPVSIRFEQARESLLVRCFHSLGWALAGAASVVAVNALHPGKSSAEKTPPLFATTPAVPPHNTLEPEKAPPASASSPNVLSASASPSDDGNENFRHSSFVIRHSVAEDSSEFASLVVTRELISTEEGTEVEYGSDNTPLHRVRYRYKERHAWINPNTGARTEIEIPREDVFLKPVSIQ